MLRSAMDIELVISIEALATEATEGVSSKPALVNCTRIVIALLHMSF
jgi:hypothetical protein